MKKYLLFALPFFVVGCSEEVKSVDWCKMASESIAVWHSNRS